MHRCGSNFDRQGVSNLRGWKLWQGRLAGCPILLLQTGMGGEQACTAVESVLERYPVGILLNIGFGAAAVENLAVGNVVLCTSFQRANHPVYSPTGDPRLPAHARLIQLAEQAHAAILAGPPQNTNVKFPLHTGACLTVDRVITNPQDKGNFGTAYSVQVIDMESYILAHSAVRWNLPFLALRSISDAVNDTLPPLEGYLNTDGTLHWPAAFHRWLTHPGELLRLLRMAPRASRAQNALAAWLPVIIPLIGSQI